MKDNYFDIEMIINLVRDQDPDRLDIIEQLRKLEKNKLFREAYVRFVSGNKPNMPGSEWQFKESIVLEHEIEGTIIIDILKDGRVGGIEFVSLIEY